MARVVYYSNLLGCISPLVITPLSVSSSKEIQWDGDVLSFSVVYLCVHDTGDRR